MSQIAARGNWPYSTQLISLLGHSKQRFVNSNHIQTLLAGLVHSIVDGCVPPCRLRRWSFYSTTTLLTWERPWPGDLPKQSIIKVAGRYRRTNLLVPRVTIPQLPCFINRPKSRVPQTTRNTSQHSQLVAGFTLSSMGHVWVTDSDDGLALNITASLLWDKT